MQLETLYAIHPGNTRNGHYVGFLALCNAYGVDPHRALNMGHPGHAAIARYRDNVIHLHPSSDGVYQLPREIK